MSTCGKQILNMLKQSLWTQCRLLSTSSCCHVNIRAGVPKITTRRTKALTYEQAQYPYNIGKTKSWNSLNTSNLHEEDRRYETTFEDFLIRKSVQGIFFPNLKSEIIIKRKFNCITAIVVASLPFPNRPGFIIDKLYFSIGFTEELLSHYLKQNVKIDLQILTPDVESRVFKYI